MDVRAINPDTLMQPRGYSQLITVAGPHKTVYIGGQDAVDKNGNLVGKGDFAAQVDQVLMNIEHALAAAGCTFQNVVKLTIYLVPGCDPSLGFAVFQKRFGNLPKPPVITVVFVAGLGSPDYLVEIDAIAVTEE